MLAVGLGVDAVGEYLAPYAPEQLCVACENSPSSVTLSGMPQYVREVKEKFDNAKVFARELKMGRAYHSPYMAAVGAVYDDLLARALVILSKHDLRWRRPRLAIISLVMG
jgi:acyl transferase domain-containing protein